MITACHRLAAVQSVSPDVRLFVGGDAQNIQRRRFNLAGDRCFSAAYGPGARLAPEEASRTVAILDSGAFSDSPECRLAPDAALARQFLWERNAERWWRWPWRALAMVSYDLLIDEKWIGGQRRKGRWSVVDADRAVRVSVDAVAYLSSQRRVLAPRKLILACQGVDDVQYEDCVRGVLQYASAADWIGLGGWCIIGWHRSWLPTFWRAMRRCLPVIADAGIGHVHLFGVMYRPALGGLLWLCDRYGLSLSTDSSWPVLATTWKNQKKAGAVCPTWEANVAWWLAELAGLRGTSFYQDPPASHGMRQGVLFEGV